MGSAQMKITLFSCIYVVIVAYIVFPALVIANQTTGVTYGTSTQIATELTSVMPTDINNTPTEALTTPTSQTFTASVMATATADVTSTQTNMTTTMTVEMTVEMTATSAPSYTPTTTGSVAGLTTTPEAPSIQTTMTTDKVTTKEAPSSQASNTPMTTGQTLSKEVAIVIGVGGGGALLLVVLLICVFCCYRRCNSTRNRADERPLHKSDLDDLSRMSMHRPDSMTVNADTDLTFLTFAGNRGQVDCIDNPTYSTTTIVDEMPTNNGVDPRDDRTPAGDGGAATMPSKARLSQNAADATNEGAAVDMENTKEDESRPMSGVSYKSGDIDVAFETLDVETV